MFDLKGKVALVTGGSRGIGLAYVKELLKNDLRAVAIVDVDTTNGQLVVDEVTQKFGKQSVIFIKTDVSDKAQLEEAFKITVETFKQLDIVINNAGILNERQWEKCVAVNFTAVITGSMLALEKYFPKYKSGTETVILNTASVAGLLTQEGLSIYCATKSGVVGFTRTFGQVHFQNTKTKILTICPGFADTAMIHLDETNMAEPYLSMFVGKRKAHAVQRPEAVAENAIHVIKHGSSGSVWLVVDDICTQVEFTEYSG